MRVTGAGAGVEIVEEVKGRIEAERTVRGFTVGWLLAGEVETQLRSVFAGAVGRCGHVKALDPAEAIGG